MLFFDFSCSSTSVLKTESDSADFILSGTSSQILGAKYDNDSVP